MPRYIYRCIKCEELSTIFHLSDELEKECPRCAAPRGLVKILSSFTTSIRHKNKLKVGDTTEEFIQESREELQQQKKELDKDR